MSLASLCACAVPDVPVPSCYVQGAAAKIVTAAAARVTGASKGGAAKGGAAKGGARAAAGAASKGAAGKASKGGAAKGGAAKGAKASPLPASPPSNQAPAEPLPEVPPPPSRAGRAVVAYNHYKGEFKIDDSGALAWADIDEEYCISFVFNGEFSVALVTDQGEVIQVTDGKFAGLADGSRYTLRVTEDPNTAAAGGRPCVQKQWLLRAAAVCSVLSDTFSCSRHPMSDASPALPPLSPPLCATAAAASKAAAERKKAWREEEEKQASLGKTKVDDITNQLKGLKAEDRSATPSACYLQLSPQEQFRSAQPCSLHGCQVSNRQGWRVGCAAPGTGAKSSGCSKRRGTSKTASTLDQCHFCGAGLLAWGTPGNVPPVTLFLSSHDGRAKDGGAQSLSPSVPKP